MSDMISNPMKDGTARPQLSVTSSKPNSEKEVASGSKEVLTESQNQEIANNQELSSADTGKLESAVAQMQDYMQSMERNLNFQLDEESGITVIKVFDSETEELIRQIPNEEAVELAQSLNNKEPMMLFSAKV